MEKARSTSANELGIRIVACKCMDGFLVGKNKANRLKRLDQMVPLVRRFLYSDIEAFDEMIYEMEKFVKNLLESFSEKISINLIASSVLFVIGKSEEDGVKLRCRLIDLAHLFPDDNTSAEEGRLGIVRGCTNLLDLVRSAREPSYA
jgi:hypothetical protein